MYTLMLLLTFSSFLACEEDNDPAPIEENRVSNMPNTNYDTLDIDTLPADTTTYPPVETRPPNTSYTSAFEGQTRVAGVKTQTAITVSTFATGLNRPWGISNLPDGRMIVTEKGGTLRIVSGAGNLSAPISGLPPVNSFGQGGLLDIAVDPDFGTNRMLYWTFSKDVSNGTATAVAKGNLSNDESKLENVQIIYTALPSFDGTAHYGSRIVWDDNGNLFICTGERSSASIRAEAQELDAALGKVLHITKNGDPVPGNPFTNQSGALDEIYSYGHRNPQGMDRHPVTGELWVVEHGPRGGDEVNLVKAGKNYGWPVISYGIEYGGAPIGAGITKKSGMEQPVYYWDPSIAPCGASFYTGSLISEWRNNLFVTALAGQHLARLVIQDNKVVGEERLLEGQGRLRDVIEGTDGALYVLGDGNNAVIYRIGL